MRLPVSGLDVSFRLPDGHDDLAILEAAKESCGDVIKGALDALSRLAKLARGGVPADGPSPWLFLTITDFEYALLGLRRFLLGDVVRCLYRCACSERMEIEFVITALLLQAQPHTPSRVLPVNHRTGWYTLPARQLAFRLPVVDDQLNALESASPYAYLEQRCIEGAVESGAKGARDTASIERVMEAMAPAVSRPIAGVCAACGAGVTLQLHVPSFVLDELRSSAAGVHGEIHAIAAAYHWQESAILGLPQLRRQAYTDAIRSGGAL